MECLVNQKAEREEGEEVTFLYRLCDGSSPKSYGINVARLAQLPQEVVMLAEERSRSFEANTEVAEADAKEEAKDRLTLSVFQSLCSIADSTIETTELAYIASELWKRFSHARKF